MAKLVSTLFLLLLITQSAVGGQMRFTKISGSFLKFDSSQRIDTGVAYASQELRLDQHEILVRTYGHGKPIETRFRLDFPDFLNFSATTENPSLPTMNGRFFDSDYEECYFDAVLPEQGVTVTGVLSKLDPLNGLSTKTVTNSATGKISGVLQERIEYLTQDGFNKAIEGL